MSFARTGQNQPSSNTVSRREARRRIERSEAAANLLTSVGMTVHPSASHFAVARAILVDVSLVRFEVPLPNGGRA